MKIAVVTGAGRGLGRLIAKNVAAKGFSVLVTDINADAAAETAQIIGNGAWSEAQDVRDPESHRQIARAAMARGDLKLWVNNAGVLSAASAWEHDDDDVRRQIEVNVLGVMWGSRAAIDAMRSSDGGHIINIASISALVPAPGMAVYAASKHAVLGFSVALQGDLQQAHLPIEISAVCPDAIETDMVRGVADKEESALLFSSSKLLAPATVADLVADLVDHPRLVVTYPPHRAFMAHAVHPFPALGLKILSQFRKLGERHRTRRG